MGKKKKPSTDGKNQNRQVAPTAPVDNTAKPGASGEQYARADHKHEAPPKDFLLEIAPNIAIAIFTFVLTVVSGYQGYALWSGAATVNKSSQAAIDSATAAKEMAAVFRAMSKPVISFAQANPIIFPPNVGEPILMALQVTNSGRSEALNYRHAAEYRIGPTRHDYAPTAYPDIPDVAPGPFLAQGATAPIPMVREPRPILTSDMLDGLKSGKYSVYVFGRVEFGDQFGERYGWRFCRWLYGPDNLFRVCDTDLYYKPTDDTKAKP